MKRRMTFYQYNSSYLNNLHLTHKPHQSFPDISALKSNIDLKMCFRLLLCITQGMTMFTKIQQSFFTTLLLIFFQEILGLGFSCSEIRTERQYGLNECNYNVRRKHTHLFDLSQSIVRIKIGIRAA